MYNVNRWSWERRHAGQDGNVILTDTCSCTAGAGQAELAGDGVAQRSFDHRARAADTEVVCDSIPRNLDRSTDDDERDDWQQHGQDDRSPFQRSRHP